MGAIEKKFVWQKKTKPLVLALEPRMLFDGAAVVVAVTADVDPNIDKTTSTSSTSTVTDPAVQNAQTEQTDSSAEVQSIDSTGNISSPEQLNEAIELQPSAEMVLSISKEKFESTDALDQAKSDAERLISEILNRPDARQTFYALFGGGEQGISPSTEWNTAFDSLVSKLSNDLTNSIRVEIRTTEEMHGAKGAFTAAGTDGKPTIYLNHDWLVGSIDAGIAGADAASITRVIAEEVGHFIDSQINGLNDTKGDEGERFSRYLIDGTDVLSLAYLIDDSDADTFTLDGQSISVELASYSFVNAYEMVYDLDNSSYGHTTILTSDIAVTERWADKEQNLHYFNTASLGAGRFSDGTGSLNFSGNDVSGALAVTMNGATYYGWISRPIKSNGIVRGFYFWTDTDFTSLAAAQLDGNQDLDSADASGNGGLYGANDTNPGVLDNRGFVLVVDQSWFNTQISSTGIAKNISNLKDGDLNGVANTTTITVANVGSSSDRVDASINYLVQTNVAPSVTADTSLSSGAVAAVESGYYYSSGNIVVAGTNGSGNVLTNDGGTNALTVAKIGKSATSQIDVASGTTSTNGAAVVGTYGTLTIGANGTYVYVVDNANPTVNAMQVGSSVTDQFTYTVSDGNGGTASTTVTITINGTDDAPVAVNNYDTAKEHTSAPDTGYNATGNVLTNDADVDTSDTKSIVGIEQVGYIAAGTVTSTTTDSLVRFDGGSGFNSSTVTGRTLYYYVGGAYRAIHGSNDALVTAIGATLISGNIYDVRLSQDVYYYLNATSQKISVSLKELSGMNVGFKSSSSEVENTSSMKTATLSLTTAVGTYTIDLAAGGLTGTLAVGARVWYDNDSSAAINYVDSLLVVTAIQYNSAGVPIKVTLDGRIPFATGTAIKFVSTLSAGQTFNGLYGTLNLASNGAYTYTPYTNMTSLDAGDSVVESFDYTMQDSQLVQSSAKLYITVYGDGTNSPLAVADTGVAYESGVGRDTTSPYATSSDPNLVFSGVNATGNVISGGTPDSFGSVGTTGTVTSYTLADGTGSTNAGVALTGSYGSLTIATDGSYTYTVSNSNSSVNSLTVGQTLTEVFWYTITNSSGLTSKTTLTITINGTNDAPVANADTGASLTEDLLTSSSGNVLVNDSDVDFADTKNVSAIIAGIATPTSVVSAGSTSSSGGTTVDGTYGRLVIGADGSYIYILGVTASQASAVQALSATSHPVEVFTYKSIDSKNATSTATLSFTVNGANEAPVNMINGESISSTSSSVFTTALNTDIQFTGAKKLSVSDSDGDLSSVTLSVEHGMLSFTGGTSVAVSGSTVTITGTQAEINAALAYLKYTPTTGYYGADYLTMASSDQTNLWDSDGLLINIANPTDVTAQTYTGPTVYESDLTSGSAPSGTRESASTTLTAPSTQTFGPTNQSGVTDFGTWSLNSSTGVFAYTLISAPSLSGSSSTDSVQIISYKSDGSITTNTVNITIVDDAPIANADTRTIANVSGPITGNIITGAGSATADTLGADSAVTVVGVVAGNAGASLTDLTKVGSAITGSYGTISIGANGAYTYTLDTSNTAVSTLASGSTLTDIFTYTIKDADGDLSYTTTTYTINGPAAVTPILTLGDATMEEGSTLSFTGSLDSASPYAEIFTLSATLGTAESTDFASDKSTWTVVYTDGSGSHTINVASDGSFTLPAGVTSFSIKIPTTADNIYEGLETFTLAATATSSYITTTDTGTGTITDDGTGTDGDDAGSTVDNDKPTLTLGDATMEEGSTLSFTATLSNASEYAEIFTLSATLGTAESTDFASDKSTWTVVYTDGSGSHTINVASDGSFTLPAGVTSFSIKIPTTADNIYEGLETFTLAATATSSYITTTDTGTGTITDDGTGTDGDDAGSTVDNDKPTLTLGDATMEEGSTLSFTATLSNASEYAEIFTLSATLGTAESTDFASDKSTWTVVYTDGSGSHTINVASDGSFTLPAGVTSFSIKIPTTADNIYEGLETFTLAATATSSYITTTDTGTGTITDDGTGTDGDDAGSTVDNDKPTLTLGDATMEEGSTLSFTATLSNASEYAEIFTLSATLGTAESTDFASDKSTWTVVYTDGSGSHTINVASDGSFTLPAGVTSFSIKIPTTADNIYEGLETFTLAATATSSYITTTDTGTGTITDDGTGTDGDDAGSTVDNDKPTLTLGDATMEEGSTLSFTATLSNASEYAEIFTLSATLGTAESTDFASDKSTWTVVYTDGSGSHTINVASDGSFTLPAGVTSFSIKIPTTADNIYEGLETFTLAATATSSYITTTDTGTGTITDDGTGTDGDDAGSTVDNDKPVISITASDSTAVEGTSNNTLAFAVSQSKSSEFDTSIVVSLNLGTVEAADITSVTYIAADGVTVVTTSVTALQSGLELTIPTTPSGSTPWAPIFTFTVADDAIYELSETLTMSVALGTGETDATLGTASVTGTIYDEDSTNPVDITGGDHLGDLSASNNPPVAVDDTFTVAEDGSSGPLNLLGNDTDPDSDPLTITSIGGVALTPGIAQSIPVSNGTVNISAAGVITFTPDANYHGPISFDYVVRDGNGGTDTGTVNGVVTPVERRSISDRGQELAIQNETLVKDISNSKNTLDPFVEKEDEINKIVSQANYYVPSAARQTVTPIRILKSGIEGQGPIKASEVDQRLNAKLDEHEVAMAVSTESGLRNTLTPPDATPSLNGQVEYKLPSGTFLGGKGRLELVATQKDGSPLPAWAQFDPVTGKLIATVPTDLKTPLEVKVQARDSVGDKAATVFKIKPRTDKISLDGKKSLTSQIHDVIRLRA